MVENLITSKSHTALNSHSLYLSSSNAMLLIMVIMFVLFNSLGLHKTLNEKKYFGNDIIAPIPSKVSQKDGVYKEYTQKGVLKQIAHYQNGKREGLQKWFDREGKLLSQTYYRNDKPHGIEKLFHPNGEVMIERHYINGLQHGLEKHFKEDALIVSINS
jgi:antitoxin component YwqK of YwqJK toxin-antitoxin module